MARSLFWLTLLVASTLAGLVAFAPLMPGGGRFIALFARDLTVRRLSLLAVAGLTATAFVFFRSPPNRPPRHDSLGA